MNSLLSHDSILSENMAWRTFFPTCEDHSPRRYCSFCKCGKPVCDICETESHKCHEREALGMIVKPHKDGMYWTSLFPMGHPMSYYIKRMSLEINDLKKLMEHLDVLERRKNQMKRKFILQTDKLDTSYSPSIIRIDAYEVEVRFENGLKVIEKNPQKKQDFFNSRKKSELKVIWIESKSMPVVEAKLRVYDEFKDCVNLQNICIHHSLENHDGIIEHMSMGTLKDICTESRSLMKDMSENCKTVFRKAFEVVLDKNNVTEICNDIYPLIMEGGETQELKAKLFVETFLKKIARGVGFMHQPDIFYRLRGDTFEDRIVAILDSTVQTFPSPLTYQAIDFKKMVTHTADEIIHILRARMDETILPQIQVETINVLKSFLHDVQKIENIWAKFRCKAITDWEKRRNFNSKESQCPYVRPCIFGVKHEKEVAKVFLEKEDTEGRKYFEEKCERFDNVQLDVVDVREERIRIRENTKTLILRENSLPAIEKGIRNDLQNIIENERNKLLANFSTIVGITIGKALQKGDEIICTPCIVLYCLDKDLRPFGEDQLPKYLKGFHIDIREDFGMFLSCENCEYPRNGCDIGRAVDKNTGSVGFLVEETSPPNRSGFLTAAHVAIKIKDCMVFYDTSFTQSNLADDEHEILHPSFSDERVGKVFEAFLGNYGSEKIGLDIAFVQTYKPIPGEKQELSFLNGDFYNERVIKNGCVTGETQGIIFNDRAVTRALETGPNVSFYNCFEIRDDGQPFCKHGDSGSAVFVIDSTSGRKIPLGIAFCGFSNSTYVCNIRECVESSNWRIYQLQEGRV